MLDTLRNEFRSAWRTVRRARLLAATIIITLALGVGANAALFEVLSQLLYLAPPGVQRPEEVRRFRQHFVVPGTRQHKARQAFSFVEYKALTRQLSQLPLAAFADRTVAVGQSQSAVELRASEVVGDYFGVLGVQPKIGRFFDSAELNGGAVAVISANLWRDEFGESPSVIGQRILLDAERLTIIGVAQPSFRGVGLGDTQIWTPFLRVSQLADSATLRNTADLRLDVIGRVSDDRLGAVSSTASSILQRDGPIHEPSAAVELAPLSDTTNPGQAEVLLPLLYRLWGAAGIILLLAWANVTNLLLIGASDRTRETAIRFALGASWSRLMVMLGIEHALLAVGAAIVASALASLTQSVLRSAVVVGVRGSGPPLHAWTILATVGVAVGAGLCSTAVTAATVSTQRLADALGSNHRGATRGGMAIRSSVLVLQAMLCVVLMTSAGMVLRSFAQVHKEWVPRDVDDLIVAYIPFATRAAPDDPRLVARFPEVARAVAEIPGVAAAAVSSNTPIQSAMFRRVFLPGRDSTMLPGEPPASLSAISPEYFSVMGMSVLKGRGISDSDAQGAPPVVVVSEYMARRLWPGEQAVGQCLVLGRQAGSCRTVVGVVEDTHIMKLREPPTMRYYMPLAQAVDPWVPRSILVRARHGSESAVAAAMRQLVNEEGTTSGKWTLTRYSDILEPELRPWRVAAVVFGGLAALAIIIGAVGMYGTVTHALNERRAEIAVRLALGADAQSIARLVMRAGVRLVGIGVAIGGLVIFISATVVQPILYKVDVHDPILLIGAPLLLLIVTCIASVGPVLAALRIKPMDSLLRE